MPERRAHCWLCYRPEPCGCRQMWKFGGPTPEQLRHLADVLESRECTGMAAQWCPVHGTCTCPDRLDAMDGPGCPLHGRESAHATAELATLFGGANG